MAGVTAKLEESKQVLIEREEHYVEFSEYFEDQRHAHKEFIESIYAEKFRLDLTRRKELKKKTLGDIMDQM